MTVVSMAGMVVAQPVSRVVCGARRAVVWATLVCLVSWLVCLVSSGEARAGSARPLISEARAQATDFGVDIILEADAPLSGAVYTLSAPTPRAVVDLGFVEAERFEAMGWITPANTAGLAARYRFQPGAPGRTRLVVELSGPAHAALYAHENRLRLSLSPTSAEAFAERAGFPVEAQDGADGLFAAGLTLDAPPPPPLVVIDPGHGGFDPGAVGPAGSFEKDVNLAAALALETELAASGFRVALTRREDVFLHLNERVEIARALGADLFISLHADAGESPKIRGASVYTLAEAQHGRAKRISSSQDWSVLDRFEDEGDAPASAAIGAILEDLAFRSKNTRSSQFAELAIAELTEVGPMVTRSHREAGYFVLLAPDVPAVLVEMGFISNPEDEANLATTAYRAKIARALSEAIDAYFAGSPETLAGAP